MAAIERRKEVAEYDFLSGALSQQVSFYIAEFLRLQGETAQSTALCQPPGRPAVAIADVFPAVDSSASAALNQ
jgi:hypothetical protein